MIDMKPLQKTYGNAIPLKAFAAYVNGAGQKPVREDITGMFDVMDSYPEAAGSVVMTIETRPERGTKQ